MSVLVKITGESGRIGWGESFGVAAPQAGEGHHRRVAGAGDPRGAIPPGPVVIHEDLYDLMRVRGFGGGYYADALAGINIALWDLFGKGVARPLAQLLGGQRRASLPAYVSGLPKATLQERCDLAIEWVGRGYRGIKFAAAVSDEGGYRPRDGRPARSGWPGCRPDGRSALEVLRRRRHRPDPPPRSTWPVLCRGALRTRGYRRANPASPRESPRHWRWERNGARAFEVRNRLLAGGISILQPEMGHTGISEFITIGRMAQTFHVDVIPHATIGIGIFLAASLHAASALQRVPYHEYQHSIFDKNLAFVTGSMACANGEYTVPDGPGLGVEPSEAVFNYIVG